MTNSIIKHLTGVDAANSIRLLRGQTQDLLFLVEGPFDQSILWAVFGVPDQCISIAHGKQNLDAARTNLIANPVAGLIVLRDRDFDTIVPAANEPYLIVTDDYDLECCFLRRTCLEEIISGFGSQGKVTQNYGGLPGAATAVAQRAATFGSALRSFQQRAIAASFDNVCCDHIDATTFAEDVGALIIDIKNKNPVLAASIEAARQDIMTEIMARVGTAEHPWYYARSCDVYAVLSYGLRKRLGSLKALECPPDMLQRVLLSVANMTHVTGANFYKKLYALIQGAQNTYSGKALLAPS